jgi:hypothetical protein
MAEKRIYTCDICGAEKRETNHWFVLVRGNAGLSVTSLTHFQSLHSPLRQSDELLHLCGQSCAVKAVSGRLFFGLSDGDALAKVV